MKRSGKIAALGASVLLVGGLVIYGFQSQRDRVASQCNNPNIINAAFGSEKGPLFGSDEWRQLHAENCLQIRENSIGSFQMIQNYLSNRGAAQVDNYDILWPAGSGAIESLNSQLPQPATVQLRANTPLVTIWSVQAHDALVNSGVITQDQSGKSRISPEWIVEANGSGASWRDYGVNFDDDWPMHFTQTHPARSNSGRVMSALIARSMAGGSLSSRGDVEAIAQDIKRYYEGWQMKSSTRNLFEEFVQEPSTYPGIVAYEFEVVELFNDLKLKGRESLLENIRVVYLDSTLVNQNPLVTVEDNDPDTDDAFAYSNFITENQDEITEMLAARGFRVTFGQGQDPGTAESDNEAQLNDIGVYLKEPVSYSQPVSELLIDEVVQKVLDGRNERLDDKGNLQLK